MYLCPKALDEIEKHLYFRLHHDHVVGGFEMIPQYKTIVSLTRIEPPLHPPGIEKITKDYGTEPENFNEKQLRMDLVGSYYNKTTEGVFAPWAFFKKDFQEIGGHDPLYAPQSKEDSDIFNRFQLNGVKFIQTWDGFVYHMTCRGSRYNPTLTTPGTDSEEWKEQNVKSARNFIRKWGHYVKHDEYMKPIIPHKYDIGIVVNNCTFYWLQVLEPWCSKIYPDMPESEMNIYIEMEQKNTSFNMNERVPSTYRSDLGGHQIIIRVDAHHFNDEDYHNIMNISDIITESGQENENMGLGNIVVMINRIIPIEAELIICKK